MELKPISNSPIRTESSSGSKSSGKAKASASDKIEISAAAKQLSVTPAEGKDLNLVHQRIKENFYNSEEVISKVASAIIKLLGK
jgi:hypothetical protein